MIAEKNEKGSEKKFYRLGELVLIKSLNKKGIVKEIRVGDYEMDVSFYNDDEEAEQEYTGNFWMFDKVDQLPSSEDIQLQMTKFHSDSRIPERAGNDEAGYDVYLNLKHDPKFLKNGKVHFELKKLTPNILPTGVGVKSNTHKHLYFNYSNERGSTGKVGMLMLSGIVDRSYRGEVFVNIVPLYDTIISEDFTTVKLDTETGVLQYPYHLAVCQMIVYALPQTSSMTIPLETFQKDKTYRGDAKMGSTNTNLKATRRPEQLSGLANVGNESKVKSFFKGFFK